MPALERRLRPPIEDPVSRTRLFLLIAAAAFAILVVALSVAGPIPQDPAYHRFADTRGFLGIPRFGDVVSNVPFLVVGLAGVWLVGARGRVLRDAPAEAPASLDDPRGAGPVFFDVVERRAWLFLFAAVALVALGSGYYHWDPTSARLVWDRLPITLVFMTFTAIQVMERMGTRAGARLLLPLLAAGIASIVWWQVTESLGRGDLRPYAVIQYFPFLLIPLMLALIPPRYTGRRTSSGCSWATLPPSSSKRSTRRSSTRSAAR